LSTSLQPRFTSYFQSNNLNPNSEEATQTDLGVDPQRLSAGRGSQGDGRNSWKTNDREKTADEVFKLKKPEILFSKSRRTVESKEAMQAQVSAKP